MNAKRNEIYARMRLPKALVNHYLASASVSNWSVIDEAPYDIFEKADLNASKSLHFSTDMSEPANRLAVLNASNNISLEIEGDILTMRKKSKFWWSGH